MPLSVDNIIQQQTGSFEGTSGTVTLPASTTPGSMVLVVATCGTAGGATPAYQLTITGFTQVASNIGGTVTNVKAIPVILAKPNVGAESSWTLSNLNSAQTVWAAFEVTGVGLDPLSTYHVAPSLANHSETGVSTISTDVTPSTSCYDQLSIAVHAARSADTSVVTFSGQTNGFTELTEVSHVNASNAVSMAVSYKPSLALGTFESTATLSASQPAAATVVVLYADGAKHAPNFEAIYGAEIGTASNMASGSIAYVTPIFDTVVGSPAVTTSNARKYSDGVGGTYCMELSSSAATEYVEWTSSGVLGIYAPTTGYPVVERLHRYFPTSLPSADVEIHSVDAGSTATMTIWFRSASGKLGIKIGSGTEVLCDQAISANKWIGIDYRYDPRVASHTCDWQVDYDSLDTTGPVTQTQAVGSGTSIANVTAVRRGWHSTRTATMRLDDEAMGKNWGMYPIGDLAILPLGPDPAGSPSVTGTEANMKVFTSNGTMSAWNAANARNALDEVPPVAGASADGIAQVTADLSTYAVIPMNTVLCAPMYTPRALRWYIAGWADSGNPATVELLTDDGANVLSIIGSGDHGLDNAALQWLCRMQRDALTTPPPFYEMTQAKLDAMALRMGRSTDATPDVGILNAFAELAITPASIFGVLSVEGDAFRVFVRQDPVTQAVVSYLVTTPDLGRGATFAWTVNGVDGSQYVGANTTWEKNIGASSIDEVTYIALTPDPA